METVISTVVALCMFVAGELKEHRIQPAMSDCLKGKRIAERTANDNIQYKCGKVEAELEEMKTRQKEGSKDTGLQNQITEWEQAMEAQKKQKDKKKKKNLSLRRK